MLVHVCLYYAGASALDVPDESLFNESIEIDKESLDDSSPVEQSLSNNDPLAASDIRVKWLTGS
jgi:hypothetical protein